MPDLIVEIVRSLHDFDPVKWDSFSAGRAFQSYRWYQFGERVMGDCPLTILLVRNGDRLVARATLWLIQNEPLPLPIGLRVGFRYFLQNHPLLICRSPLSDSNGLILADNLDQESKRLLQMAAQDELKRQHASFLLFDFMNAIENAWPEHFKEVIVADPGTIMNLTWQDFDSYLDAGNKKDRQHYKRTLHKAEELGLKLSRRSTVADVEEALRLIRNVSRKFGSTPNPWMRGMLENLQMIDSTWLEVRRGNALVGCGALVRDNDTLLATALGLAEDIPYAYFLLIYATIQDALEHRMKAIRLGSGAYDVKRRLGFKLEDNNHVILTGAGPLSKGVTRLASWMMS
ncbi:MAG TPA: GNAT family N-acetyltransferase [Anaerolineales bacterium]